MARSPLFSHRHYVRMAEALHAALRDVPAAYAQVAAETFADGLRGTNPKFNYARFVAAAMGEPATGRDRAR